MATLYSQLATGNWSNATTLWNTAANGSGTYQACTNADAAVVQSGHVITVDDTSAVALSVSVTGTVKFSRTANSTLTVQGKVTVNSGGTWDQGKDSDTIPASYTATLILNNAASAASTWFEGASGFASITFNGVEDRTRWSTLSADVSAGGTTCTVADSTGWAVGDELLFAPCSGVDNSAQDAVDVRTITGLAPITFSGLAYAHKSGAAVGNLYSNCIVKCANASFRGKTLFILKNSAVDTLSIRYTKFENFSDATNRCVIELNPEDNTSGAQYRARKLKSFYANILTCTTAGFNSWTAIGGFAGGNSPSSTYVIDNSIFYHSVYEAGYAFSGMSGTTIQNNMVCTAYVNGAAGGILTTYNDNHFSGRGGNVGWGSTKQIYNRNKFYGRWMSLFIMDKNVLVTELNNNDFGVAVPLVLRYLNNFIRNTGYAAVWDFVSTNDQYNTILNTFIDPDSSYANHSQYSIGRFINKNNDITQQEIHKGTGKVFRNNSTTKRSTSSISLKPLAVGTDLTHDITIPVVLGESVEVAGYLQYDATFYNSGTWTAPTAKLIDTDGTTVLETFTPASSATPTWYPFILNGTAGSTGNCTVRFTANPSSVITGTVYFDGVANTPMIVKARHYGWTFDETNPKRTRNTTVTTTAYTTTDLASDESAAYGITGIAVTGATSAIVLSASKTFQQLYDYTQAWSCYDLTNLGYTVPVTGSGANGSPVLTAVGNVTVNDGFTLNGNGSLAIPSGKTLTTEFASGVNYTYTNGVWSQLSIIPTFSGGTLTLGALVSTSPGFTMATGAIVFGATSAAWDLSDCTISSGVTLSNTSGAGITVAMPAGYPTTTIGSGATEIIVTAPVVERGLEFTLSPTGCQVKVFATGTDTELFSDNAASALETWDDATAGSITVDYVVQKAGYLPVRVTGVVVTGAVGTGIQAVAVTLSAARWYQASSGLTINTNAFANAGTKLFGLTATSTLQNFASYMLEQWIALGDTGEAFANKEFPIEANGPNSFTFRLGWEWDLTTYANSISNLSRDGQRYMSAAGAVTASWAAILTSGALAGSQVRYQQSDAGTTVDAENTGEMDQLVQIYGDATHGNFDKTGYLVLKVQREGYDQAESNVVTLYGTLEDQLYVVGLTPTANGIATGDPALTAAPVITQGTYTEDSKTFSVKITDAASPNENTGEEILRWLRYNFAAGGTFQSEDAFNWHDLVQKNGSAFKTVNGTVYGTAATKGVLVYKNDGTTLHPDFTLFTADDGTTYAPPVAAPITWAGALNATTCLLYNDSNAGALIDTQIVSGAGGYSWSITLPHGSVTAGDNLRLRYGNKEYYADELQGTMTANGLVFVGSMVLHPVYAGWALNGATYDQANGGPFTMDGANLQVDIAAGSTTGLKTQLGAWTQYLMTLPAGLDAFYGAWDLLALNQIRQNVAVIDVKIDVPTAGALYTFTDNNVNYYRSDFTYPGNVEAGHGLIAITYNAEPFVATTSGDNVVTGDQSSIVNAIFSQAGVTPISSDMKKTNGETIIGDGTALDKFRSHLVP